MFHTKSHVEPVDCLIIEAEPAILMAGETVGLVFYLLYRFSQIQLPLKVLTDLFIAQTRHRG